MRKQLSHIVDLVPLALLFSMPPGPQTVVGAVFRCIICKVGSSNGIKLDNLRYGVFRTNEGHLVSGSIAPGVLRNIEYWDIQYEIICAPLMIFDLTVRTFQVMRRKYVSFILQHSVDVAVESVKSRPKSVAVPKSFARSAKTVLPVWSDKRA